ncbi:MAG TPA: sigma 54-interacting transcriptional regulator [Marinagarivorans sp.]
MIESIDLNHYCPEAILLIDPVENAIVHFNSACERLFNQIGFKNINNKPSHYFKRCLPELIGFSEAILELGSGLTEELFIYSPKGEEISLEVTGSKVVHQNHHYLSLCIRHRRNHAKRQLQHRMKRYHQFGSLEWQRIHDVFSNIERENQLLLQAAGEGIYGVNAEGVATFFNPAAERILGWKGEEIIGKNIHALIHHTHKDGSDFCAHECPIYAAFKDGAVKSVSGDVFWTRSGKAVDVDYTSTPIVDNGHLVGAVVVFRDVSERIQSENKLRKALEEVEQLKFRLEQENAYLQEEINAEYNFHQLVGNSLAINNVIQQIQMVAPTDATTLITGESGTGKELIARAIHAASMRSERPLVRVNCAAVPAELFESEFFGHCKGAFSGAFTDRTGRFELADGGTLFLDEVGELPLELQSKLLRVLQDSEFERVGESTTRTVNVRLIAATNQNLKNRVEQGLFREDLYFRLNVFPIHSAPLRERLDDIHLLIAHFIHKICVRLNKPVLAVPLTEINKLMHYHWPGNIRELENFLERQIILTSGNKLHISEVPTSDHHKFDSSSKTPTKDDLLITEPMRKQMTKEALQKALTHCAGKIYGENGAAALLGLKPTTLSSRLQKYHIDHRQYRKSS